MKTAGRIRRVGIVTVLVCVAALLVPGWAVAADGADASMRIEALRTAVASPSDSGEVSAYQSGETCFADPRGDTRRLQADGTAGPPGPEPRADIVRHCVNFRDSLSLSLEVAEFTDPETDANWENATFIGWFLDTTGNGEGDYYVDYSLDRNGDLGARVMDIRRDTPTVSCEIEPTATDVYAASGITRACIGNASSVAVQVGMFYDEAGDVFFDVAPGDDAFTTPTATQARTASRLAGPDRDRTAVQISRAQFPTPADVDTVYLARRDVFADATVGGVLTDGPILLVPRCATPHNDVLAEIRRLNPERVIALGGPAAICDRTLAQAAQNRTTSRLAGDNRYLTAIQISRHEFGRGADEVYLARGDLFADAVAGGVLTNGPILLVPSCGALPTAVRDEIRRVDPDRVVALGGTSAVCAQMLRDGAAAGRAEEGRLGGAGRIETAVEISRYQFPRTADVTYLARADLFADAVVGGVLTAGPILLVPQCGALPDAVRAEISRLSSSRVVALGGPAAVCDDVLQAARRS
jgi:putative cell wall-binding protein